MRAATRSTRGALVVALSALGLALRVYRLDHDPLWFDEAYTAITARRPPGEILALLRNEDSAPLYYLLLHGWRAVVGDGDGALRLLSALTGAAVVPATYVVGAALFGSTAGLIATALAALAPLHVHYSRELRMYGLIPLLVLGVLYGVYRLVRSPDWRGAAILAASLTAGLYLHYFFLFLVPLALAAAWSPTPRCAAGYTAIALAFTAVAFAPWMATRPLGISPDHSLDWIADWWASRSLWLAVPSSLEVLGPAARYPAGWFTLRSSTPGGLLSLAFAAATLGTAVFFIARGSARERDGTRTALVLTVAAVLVPLLAALVVSLVRTPIYLVARYDMIAWAPYCLLAGAVLARLPAAVRIPALALWLGLAIFTLVPHFTTNRPIYVAANYGHVLADLVGRRATRGDLVIFTGSTRPTTEHYLGAFAERLRLVSFPLGTDDHLGWIDVRIAHDPAFAAAEAHRLTAWVAALQPSPERVWLVEPYTPGVPTIVEDLRRLGYTVDDGRSDAHVVGFRRAAGAG